ncbi:MAG: aminotransferase class I/II-fold pyridoxal phosphate-dependent enzyme [Saprospiraceae bacterium]|nr:aminotransferase class I/II-fold pyridoxal phosphate-dependent enzyme [Saprospiraceae bacterium]HRG67775.1 methionine aminotransferase [Saprospiraceae bacterium]
MPFKIESKLPQSGISIFAQMTAAAIRNQAINLAQGFPNFSPPEELFEFLNEAVRNGYNQYAAMPGLDLLRNQIALRIQNDYQFTANPESEITITAGATQAIYTIISSVIQAGDRVLIFEPAYDSYGPSVLVNGGIPVYLRLQLPDFKIPWDELETILKKEKIKIILINNPHNPAGRVLNTEDILRLQQLTKDLNTLIIWDEVYDLLIFDQLKHQSALLYPELMDRSVVVFSMGKTLHNTGWKVGYTIAKPEITNEIRKLHQFTVFSVNTPAQYAIAKFMETHRSFFNLLPKFYQQKRDYFFEKMNDLPFNWLPCEGSYFALADYSNISKLSDREFAMELVEKFKVAAIPLSPFYHDGYDPKLLRFCFAKTTDTIDNAATQLKIKN